MSSRSLFNGNGENEAENRYKFSFMRSNLFIGLFFSAGCLLPLIVVLFLSDRMIKEKNQQLIENQALTVCNSVKSGLLEYIHREIRELYLFSNMGGVAGIILEAENGKPHLSPNREKFEGNDRGKLSQLKTFAGPFDFNELLVTDAEGYIVCSICQADTAGLTRKIMIPETKIRMKNIHANISGNGFSFCTDTQTNGPDKGKTAFYITMGVNDATGRRIGIIGEKVSDSRIKSFFSKSLDGRPDTKSFLLDDTGHVIAGEPDKTISWHFAEIFEMPRQISIHHQQGKIFAGIIRPMDDSIITTPKWSIFTQTAIKSDLSGFFVFSSRSWWFSGLAAAYLMALCLVARQYLLLPLRKYISWAGMALTGHTGEYDRPKGHSEIDSIGQSVFDLSQRIQGLIRYSTTVSHGDFGRPFAVIDENDILGNSINGINRYFMKISNKIQSLSQGSVFMDEIPESMTDELNQKLNVLSGKINKMNEDNRRRLTTSFVQTELIRQISGELDLAIVSERILAFLCMNFKAAAGVIYVRDHESKNFFLSGSYGCVRKNLSDSLREGEGISGQSIKDKTYRIVPGGKGNHLVLKSGLIVACPGEILSYPLLIHEDIIAVIELGFASDIKSDLIAFLNNNSESVATAVHVALNRDLTERLLAKTIEQSERMLIQQENLKKTNMELESQTIALKQSELTLRSREEELKKANKALEDHSIHLEKQKQIVDQKNMELEETKIILENKARELTRSNSYKSKFLANMSHELRTPLNSIILLSGIIANATDSNNDKIVKFSELINKSGKELLNIIEEVLDLTLIATGKMALAISRYRIGDIKKILMKIYEPLAKEKNLEFSIAILDNLPDFIDTDAAKLERLLKNLISNAFKFTEKGHIILEVKRPAPDADLYRSSLDPDKTILFSLTDTGEGIPESMHAVVFDAFKQVDGSTTRKHGGVGLGLSIADELAGLLHGEIQLQSEIGKGSCFCLYLPEIWADELVKSRQTMAL